MSDRHRRSKFEAYIGHYQNFFSYLGSYKLALDILINHVDDKEGSVDTIAYPILFLARHVIELGLKANIKYFHKYSGVDNHVTGNKHYLKPLQDSFKVHIKKTIENLKIKYDVIVEKSEIAEFDKYFAQLDKLTDIFELLDKGSDAFRYPINKDGKASFGHNQTLNVLDVIELLNEVEALLSYTAAVFSRYNDYVDMIEGYYEEEIKSMYNQEGY